LFLFCLIKEVNRMPSLSVGIMFLKEEELARA